MTPDGPYIGQARGDLRRLDLGAVRIRARQALAAFPEVAGAYLFGSALDFVGPRSDIDVGILLRSGLAPEAELELAERLDAALGSVGPHAFQASILRPQDCALTFSVLRDGELIYVSDEERVTDILEQVGRQHDDLEPFRRTFYAALGTDV